jgi:hypothetical protein
MSVMSASAMQSRLSLRSLFRARDSNKPFSSRSSQIKGRDGPGDRRRRLTAPRVASAGRASKAPAVRWEAIAANTVSNTGRTRGGYVAACKQEDGTGKMIAKMTHRSSCQSSYQNTRTRRVPTSRLPAYVGEGSPEKEIIVCGDGDAVVMEDEESDSRKLGWDTAFSRVTLLQLATCAATGVAEPLLGTIDAYWVATLGTTALASLGPNTAVYSSVIAVLAAHGFGTAATRVMAVAIEKDERARRDGGLVRGDKTLAGQYLIAVTTTAVAFGTTCALLIALFPEFVVTLVGVDQSVVAQAAGYMRARAAGVPAVCLIAVLGGAFQAARDAKTYVLRVSQILTQCLPIQDVNHFMFTITGPSSRLRWPG